MGNNRILVIRFTAQSQPVSMACYGACLKWLLPELSFSDRWSRRTKLWERDCFNSSIGIESRSVNSFLRTRNEFTDLLSMFAHIISLRGKIVHYCREIRDPVWSYMLIDLCSSFAAWNCNACFSQIFENLRKEHLVVSIKRKKATGVKQIFKSGGQL